jgi:sec-independent protein translocase protein TatB
MFDSIGFQELMLIGFIALIVVGPKDLPLLMRKAGQFMNKMRGMAADFRANFDELARQAELDELRKEVEALRNNQPLRDIQDELMKPFDTGIDPYAPVTPLHDNPAHHAPAQLPQVEADTAQGAGQETGPSAKIAKPRKPRARKKKDEIIGAFESTSE